MWPAMQNLLLVRIALANNCVDGRKYMARPLLKE